MAKKTNWTPDQKNAIISRNGTILVSAAAGSGKTAVLVERVLERLTDKEKPCDADKLLIVTFTKAATAEMRSRLAKAIRLALEENPEDENLQRQQMLLPSATICTIDSFCCNLIRENFDSLGISPDFKLIDENDSKLLQKQAVATVIEGLYEEDDDDFKNLVELLFSGRDDTSLEDNIINLYTYSRAYPSPDAWLDSAIALYNPEVNLADSPIADVIGKNALALLDYAIAGANAAINEWSVFPELTDCSGFVTLGAEKALAENIQSLLKQYDFDSVLNIISNYVPDKWSTKRGSKDEPTVQNAKNARDILKDTISTKLPEIICTTKEEYKEDLEILFPLASKLIAATKQFSDEFYRLKVEKNSLDFSDTELLALRLLVEDSASKAPIRTMLATELSKRFEEILIDEYQDTNELQDMLFRAISKDENNLFMVGDVKQSIYRFRQAMPEIFLSHKESFKKYSPKDDCYPATITLSKNFRSRKGITEYINFLFQDIMSRELGDIEYNDDEKLYYGANYEELSSSVPDVEVHVLQDDSDEDKTEKEARYIASIIASKIKESESTPTPLKFSDFCILMQSPKSKAPVYEKILNENGIPVYADVSGGFLRTIDVQIMISFLRVIDNPLQDIPLVSVLMSPIFGFTTDDIARIRIDERNASIYSAILESADKGNEKAIEFLNSLQLYRKLSIALPAGELIRHIYDDTAFIFVAGAMPNGSARTANLQMLLKYADSFDQTNTLGISGFIRYLDKLSENDIEPAGASSISPNSNTVRIMSIHKSKGLEFKVCILADTAKQFNTDSIRRNLILHPTLGIGIKRRDTTTSNLFETLIHTAVKLETKRAELSETIRVLYVALTRACEELIITGTIGSYDKTVSRLTARLNGMDTIHPEAVKSCNSFMDWILMSGLSKEVMFKTLVKFVVPESETEICESLNVQLEEPTFNKALYEEIKKRMEYVYPYSSLMNIEAKRAASKIDENGLKLDFFASARPSFMSKQSLTPAQRGTCLHKFMQYANYERAKCSPSDELNQLVTDGFLTNIEAEAIDLSMVHNFFQSKIAMRIFNSPNVMREKKFAVLEDLGLFNEKVLIQGIADCVFEENGKLIILDYKTDRVKTPEELIKNYKPQLLTYCSALKECTGKEIAAAYLYSFALGSEIQVV